MRYGRVLMVTWSGMYVYDGGGRPGSGGGVTRYEPGFCGAGAVLTVRDSFATVAGAGCPGAACAVLNRWNSARLASSCLARAAAVSKVNDESFRGSGMTAAGADDEVAFGFWLLVEDELKMEPEPPV